MALGVRAVTPKGPSSLCLLAPECGSWGRVCRGTTERSIISPLGFPYEFVSRANLVISRSLNCKLVFLLYDVPFTYGP